MSDDVTYRGYRIVYDVREVPGTKLWTGKGAAVEPADAAGIERVSLIFTPPCFFSSDKAAYDCVVSEAKKWINKQMRNDINNEVTGKAEY